MNSRKKQFAIFVSIYAIAFLVFRMTALAAEAPAAAPSTAGEATKTVAPIVAPIVPPETTAKPVISKKDDETKKQGFNKMFAKFETSMGDFKIELHFRFAPISVENFVGLVEGTKSWTDPKTKEIKTKKPYYNGLIFHRIIKNFMIQGGDPTGTGSGGPGYKFNDEFHPDLHHDKEGVVSMANSGPNTNGSQFFITLAPQEYLDKERPRRGYSIFGQVVEGMDIVKAIGATPTNRADDRPKTDVVIKKITIIRE